MDDITCVVVFLNKVEKESAPRGDSLLKDFTATENIIWEDMFQAEEDLVNIDGRF